MLIGRISYILIYLYGLGITRIYTTMEDNNTMPTTTTGVVTKTMPPRLKQIFDELKQQCEEKMKVDPPLVTEYNEPYCDRKVDSWGGCWPDTKAGAMARIACPNIPGFNTNEFAYRQCTDNGTWFNADSKKMRSVNYTLCRTDYTVNSEDVNHIYIFIGGFSLSVITLLISLAIFCKFRQLRCDRITIHKNLFLSYVFTGISWIMYYVLVVLNGDVIFHNPVWCRVLHVLCQYFTVCNFFWMFCEGLYLNTIVVYTFTSGRTLIACCYVIGWGVPVILTSIYAGVRSGNEHEAMDCWYIESNLQWIMYGPVVVSVVINAIFLINIICLLITKLRQMPEVAQTNYSDEDLRVSLEVLRQRHPVALNNRTISTWKAARATLILVPLLGLQYLLFPIRPPDGSSLDVFYHIFVALLVSLQGAFVSTIYCFCNSEVLAVITRKYTQRKLMRKRSSVKSNSGQPGTAYTTIDHVSAQNNYSTVYKESVLERLRCENDEV